jgi:hypothetical protein
MKIFRKFYVRRLYRVYKLEDILEVLKPWVKEVLYENSPFLRQVASYRLRDQGGSSCPRIFKTILGNEIFRLMEIEDLEASLRVAIVVSYREYNPAKGNVSLVNWLSWRIPYELSKLVTWKVTHPIGPFDEAFSPAEIDIFERTFELERQIVILSKDLQIDKQAKYYYLKKAKEK